MLCQKNEFILSSGRRKKKQVKMRKWATTSLDLGLYGAKILYRKTCGN